ncbi:MAG: GNAT family N-acetyltransferase [Actinobacteria bacterium]|nr:GNAT family N-acetyltransferase [Actinomycetota bacterium]MBO0785793.1 GNAT family N-acetyltransferase [Actinomycetota bacterium]
MTDPRIRDADNGDLDAIARVALATGQDEEWSGSDPAYVRHLLAHGRVIVAEHDGEVAGFGATRPIGSGPAAVTMLCDLFVSPGSHGSGLGQAMLAALWQPGTPRMTFSSLHAHALPLYTRAGLDAWWPLLYLTGDVTALRSPAGWAVTAATAAEAGALERDWTGIDRTADHQAWAARPGGQPVTASRAGQVLAAGTVGGADEEYGIVHLALDPAGADPGLAGAGGRDGARAADETARDAVLAVLASLDPPDGRARACLPAPHPAVRPLLAAGWRCGDTDLFMATDPALLDPRRAVPSPALA